MMGDNVEKGILLILYKENIFKFFSRKRNP
jgi:hypothetical protein